MYKKMKRGRKTRR